MWKVIAAAAFVNLAVAAPTNLNERDFAPINEFALKLLDNTYAFQENFGRQNFAISPVSVWSVFSLLAEGSAGETFQELMRELRLPRDTKATQALHLAVDGILRRNSNDVILHGQKTMFSDCSLEIHPEFCQAATAYKTDIYSVDPSNTTKLADKINYFICIATEGRIQNAVKPEFLENLRMILVDALYFKANWTSPFDPLQTKESPFYNIQGKTIGRVNMMYHKAPHKIYDSPLLGAQVLEMNYGRNEEFSMLMFLPADGMPLKKLLNDMASTSVDWLLDFKAAGSTQDVNCYIPRFTISSQLDLIPPMKYTGIHTIFDREKSELPGVSDSPLFVSKTIQNVEIEVTETGTVAASSTVVGIENRVLVPTFDASREFVFLITERNSNVILFAGVYSEPSVV